MAKVEYKWLVAAAFVFGIFMDLLDLTIVNVALPTLGQQFHAGSADLEWVITGYLLSLAIWIPASGWLGDRFGTKKVFLFAITVFLTGSLLCGLSWSIGSLIAFRVLQGVGGGMITPVGTAMLFRAFPPHERAQAALILTVPTVVAPALGPVLGGALVDYVSWHWIFFVNIPIGIVGFFFGLAVLREERQPTVGSFDLRGFLFSGAGLVLVLFALSRGPEAGWTSAQVLGTGVGGILVLGLMVFTELGQAKPMLDLRLLGDRMFRNANVVFFAMMGGLMGVLFLLPLFLQDLRGYSAIDTGLILMPQALAIMMFGQLSGRLYPRVGPRRLLMFALTLFAVSSGLFLFVGLQTSVIWIIAILFIRGIAMAFTFIPLQASAFATISPADTGQASSIFNTNRQVAASFGTAILATALTTRLTAHNAALSFGGAPSHGALLAFHDAFFVGLVLAVVGIFFAFLIRDEDAAASMRNLMADQPQAQPEPVL